MAIKNMLLNSDFEHPTNPTYNWQLEAPYVTPENTGGTNNSKCVKFSPNPAGGTHVLSQSMDLVPGATYQFKCRAFFNGPNISLCLAMICNGANGQSNWQYSSIFSGSGWKDISHNFTVPSNVTSENVWLQVRATNTPGAPGSSHALVDDVQLIGDDGVGSGAVNTYRRTADWTMIRTQPNGLYYYTIWPNALVKIAEKLPNYFGKTWYRVTRLHDAGGWCSPSEIGLPEDTPAGTHLSAVCNTFAVRIWDEEHQSNSPFKSPPTGRMPLTVVDYGHSTMYKTFYGFKPLTEKYVMKSMVDIYAVNRSPGQRIADIASFWIGTHKADLGMGSDPNSQWCMWFANWMIGAAGLGQMNPTWITEKNAAVAYQEMNQLGLIRSQPEIGSIFFNKDNSQNVDHCGLVVSDPFISGGKIYVTVVEGDYIGDDVVTTRDFELGQARTLGYGVPAGM
jgi:hypothetical protein